MLVSIGLVSLLLATFEYRQNIRGLGGQYEHNQRSLAVLVAALISILGLFLMIFDNRQVLGFEWFIWRGAAAGTGAHCPPPYATSRALANRIVDWRKHRVFTEVAN